MVISCRTTGCIRSVRGLARRAPNADERQLQFSGGGRALRPLAVPDPLFVGGSAAKDTGADREGQTNRGDRKSTRLNSSHGYISYAVFCLKKKKQNADHLARTDMT